MTDVDLDDDGKIDYTIAPGVPVPPEVWQALQDHQKAVDSGNSNGDHLPPKPQVPDQMPPPPAMTDNNHDLGSTLPRYDNGPNGPVTVNTEALRLFSNTLDHLAEPLRNLKIEVDAVTVHPGAFYQAYHLQTAIQGDASLQRNTSKMISQALDALALIQRSITDLTTEYDTVEELNSAGADDLKTYISDAKTAITKMGS